MSTYISEIELGSGERHIIRDPEAVHVSELFDMVYPVGAIYMSVRDMDPGLLFGGEWERWGEGRVPVGVASSDTSFNTVEKTGGSKTVKLTAAQSGVPKHSHNFTQPTVPKHAHTFTQPKVPKHTHTFTQPTVAAHGHTFTQPTVPEHGHSFTQPSVTGGATTAASATLTGELDIRRNGNSNTDNWTNVWAPGGTVSVTQKGSGTNWANSKVTNGGESKADVIKFNFSHGHSVPAHTHTVSGGAVKNRAAFKCVGGEVANAKALSCSGGAVGDKAEFACTGGAVAEKAAFACTGGKVADNTEESASAAHTNLQPYITCYMWKRVS